LEDVAQQPPQNHTNIMNEQDNNENSEHVEFVSEFSMEDKLIRKWMMKWLGKPVTEACVQDLLEILSNTVFNSRHLSGNVAKLKKVDNELIENLPLQTITLNGRKMFYHDIFEVLKVILSSVNLTKDWVFNYSVENSHWSGYPAWQTYEDFLKLNFSNNEEFPLLLLLVVFIDDYLHDSSRKKMNTGIYFSLANFPSKLYFLPKSKFCLCTFESESESYYEVLKKVVVEPCSKLVDKNNHFKAFFAPLQRELPFWGGLHCFVHDHIGAVKTLMKLGPQADNSSRFFSDSTTSQFHIIKHPNERSWISPKLFIENLTKISNMQDVFGKKGEAKELAKSIGVKIPLKLAGSVYEIPIFCNEVFKRTPSCELHLNTLGLLKR